MTDNIQMKGTMTIRIFQHYPAASGGGQVESIAYKEPKKIHLEAEMCPHHDNEVRDVDSGRFWCAWSWSIISYMYGTDVML